MVHFLSDEEKLQRLHGDLEAKEQAFAYVTLGKLDAIMHAVGNRGQAVDQQIDWLGQQIHRAVAHAKKRYSKVVLHLFSDHGMHQVTHLVDLQREIQKLGLSYGEDYVAMYDATMARFWFLNDQSRQKTIRLLETLETGSILSEKCLQEWGVFFPDHQFGEIIFQLNSGGLIVPSFVNDKRVAGMHGYPPTDADSHAAILSSEPIPEEVNGIQDIFTLLKTVMPNH